MAKCDETVISLNTNKTLSLTMHDDLKLVEVCYLV